MRVLWLAPWFRSLAHIYGSEMVALGHDVLVISGDGHPDPGHALVNELVLPARLREPSLAADLCLAAKRIHKFAPDVAILDDTWDPRFSGLWRLAPRRWLAVHDAVPHDETHIGPAWQQRVIRWNRARAENTVVFSDAVARRLSPSHTLRTAKVSLTSDMRQCEVPDVAASSQRKDFVIAGRLRPYKNFELIAEAWKRHMRGPHYRGDKLVIQGAGSTTQIPALENLVVKNGFFAYADVANGLLSGYKANVCVYRTASQSGVQLLSMQLGVAPIVSAVGGLPEYQPPGFPIIEPDDPDSLAGALDLLADPGTAAAEGLKAAEWYRQHFAADVAAEGLMECLNR